MAPPALPFCRANSAACVQTMPAQCARGFLSKVRSHLKARHHPVDANPVIVASGMVTIQRLRNFILTSSGVECNVSARAIDCASGGRRMTPKVQTHQPGEADFRSILPEDIDWRPFPAFPPSARLAVLVGE